MNFLPIETVLPDIPACPKVATGDSQRRDHFEAAGRRPALQNHLNVVLSADPGNSGKTRVLGDAVME